MSRRLNENEAVAPGSGSRDGAERGRTEWDGAGRGRRKAGLYDDQRSFVSLSDYPVAVGPVPWEQS